MINIQIITVGKIKEKYLMEGLAEYQKRLTKFAHLEIIEIPDERIPDNPSVAEKEKVLETEGEKILLKIPQGSSVITLEIEGEQMTSLELAAYINKVGTYQTSKIVFVIGGSLGLSKSVKQIAHKALSFSKMTFPHQLMRLVLLEQIYRSFMILSNNTYHK
jgi:23S rRNA (pseudouridine1915-N3)-methyltransferase